MDLAVVHGDGLHQMRDKGETGAGDARARSTPSPEITATRRHRPPSPCPPDIPSSPGLRPGDDGRLKARALAYAATLSISPASLPVAIAIRRGFRASGSSRLRVIDSKPFSRFASSTIT